MTGRKRTDENLTKNFDVYHRGIKLVQYDDSRNGGGL